MITGAQDLQEFQVIFDELLRKSEFISNKPNSLDLKYVTQAGGKLAPIFIDEFRRLILGGPVYSYVWTDRGLPPDSPGFHRRHILGERINAWYSGVDLRVVNETGEQINPGETGEVIASGDNIMMGYFADEGTKNAIRDGWLYTGDLELLMRMVISTTARSKEIT